MLGVALLSLLVGFSGALIPGPLFAVTLQQALLVGWTAGLWLAVGHMAAELALVGTLRAGLGELLRRRQVTRVIGLVGGLVLLYFAWGMIATALSATLGVRHATAASAMSAGTLVGQGVLLTIANPTWYLWWATAGVGLIAGQSDKYGARAWPAFFLGHSLADYLWYILVSALIAVGGAFFSVAVHRALILACAAGILAIAVIFLTKPLLDWRRERLTAQG